MNKLRIYLFFALGFCFITSLLSADCRGKIDVAPAYVKMNLVESGKTVRTRRMYGGRIGIDHFLYKALLVRVNALVADGEAHFETYAAGLGLCFPYKDFHFTPTAGATYTKIKSPLKIDNPFIAPFPLHLKEKFDSIGPYIGLDAQWTFRKKWRIGGGIQYSWSHTHAKVKPIFKGKSNSKGPNYTLLLERDITSKWSVNIAGAYNRSLSHEKHGLKASGLKVGVTYWY